MNKKKLKVLVIVLIVIVLTVVITNVIYNLNAEKYEIRSYDCCDVPKNEYGFPAFSPAAPCGCNHSTIFEKTLAVFGIIWQLLKRHYQSFG